MAFRTQDDWNKVEKDLKCKISKLEVEKHEDKAEYLNKTQADRDLLVKIKDENMLLKSRIMRLERDLKTALDEPKVFIVAEKKGGDESDSEDVVASKPAPAPAAKTSAAPTPKPAATSAAVKPTPTEVKKDEPKSKQQNVVNKVDTAKLDQAQSTIKTQETQIKNLNQQIASLKDSLNETKSLLEAKTKEAASNKSSSRGLGKAASYEVPEVRTRESKLSMTTKQNEDVAELQNKLKKLERELQLKTNLGGNDSKRDELLLKAKELLFEQTKVAKNQDQQIQMLNNQILSMKDVQKVTKEMLEVRNTELDATKERMETLELRLKTERDLMERRFDISERMYAQLKKEHDCQTDIFKELKAGYQRKIELLSKELEKYKPGQKLVNSRK